METAQAADLSFADMPTARHLGVCGAGSSGAFALPGSDTCLRIGGFVAAEYSAHFAAAAGKLAALSPVAGVVEPQRDLSRSVARGELSIDVRTQTELGPLRVYVSLRTPKGLRGTEFGRP